MANIRKHGNGYQARIRRRGWPEQTKTFQTKAAADRWVRQVEHEMDQGAYVALTNEQQAVTLRTALERYELEITPSKRGAHQERKRIKQWKERFITKHSLARIKGTDIAAWRDERLKEVSATTVRLELAIISHLYTVARQEWGMPVSNPVKNIRKPTVDNARDRRLEGTEESRLIDAAPTQELATIIRLAIETAMRLSEIARLEWRHIDLARHTAHLPTTKTGKVRSVPLTEAASAALEHWPRRIDGHVFGPDEKRISARVTKQFRLLCIALGIKNLHFHDLRHEATSRLFERGLDVMEVASITGHKTLSQLKRYTHPRAERIAAKLRA